MTNGSWATICRDDPGTDIHRLAFYESVTDWAGAAESDLFQDEIHLGSAQRFDLVVASTPLARGRP